MLYHFVLCQQTTFTQSFHNVTFIQEIPERLKNLGRSVTFPPFCFCSGSAEGWEGENIQETISFLSRIYGVGSRNKQDLNPPFIERTFLPWAFSYGRRGRKITKGMHQICPVRPSSKKISKTSIQNKNEVFFINHLSRGTG